MSKKTWKSKFFRKSREIGGRKTFRFLYSEDFRVETKVFGEVMNFSTRNVRGGTPSLPVPDNFVDLAKEVRKSHFRTDNR